MIARAAAVITAILGVGTGLFVLFGPTGTRCTATSIGQSGPGEAITTLVPMRCETTRMVDVQAVWPMPLLALAVWSLAPLLAVLGAWSGRQRLVTVALVIEVTSILSFGAGPYYVPFVVVPLAITWFLARRQLSKITM